MAGNAFAQRTVDLSISNKTISGGFFYFDINLKRTSNWTTNFLGDCSFYFDHNASALSTVVLDYSNPNVSVGNGFTVTSGSNVNHIYVTVDFGFGSSWSPDLNTVYKLFTVKMTITNAAQESDLEWATGFSAVFNASDESVDESYSGSGDMSLPVQLTSFSAQPTTAGVQLSWTTESETDNLGFILERSVKENNDSHLQRAMIASYETDIALHGQGNSSESHEYDFTDSGVEMGQQYIYRLSDVNTSGAVHVYDEVTIILPDAPVETVIEPPFPNPFNPETKIGYKIAKTSTVEITVYDLLGCKVRTLVNEAQSAGSFNIYWHGDDASGRQVATGTYLIVLKTKEGVRAQKAVMLR